MAEGQLDHLANLPDLVAEPADVFVVHLRDLRLLLFDRLLRDFDVRLVLDEHGVRPRRERRDHEVELAAHDAHADHVAAGDRAPPQDLRHVLLPAHDADRFRRREAQLVRGPGERLPKADLVVQAHARVATLHAVHADHPAVRVLRVAAAHARGGRLRSLDEYDVPFLEFQDPHDFRVDPDDPATGVRGLRLGDPKELLTAARHGGHVSYHVAPRTRRRLGFATNRGYLNSWNGRPSGTQEERKRRAGSYRSRRSIMCIRFYINTSRLARLRTSNGPMGKTTEPTSRASR